jgi:hypothetical protein
MIEEIWKEVPSLPEYEASSLGRIRRKPFVGVMPRGGERQYGGKEWFGVWHKDTKRFMFTFKGKNYKVAVVVCEAFHGKAPHPYPMSVCMHLDENSRNNRADNLAWGSQKENLNAPGFLAYCSSDERKAAIRAGKAKARAAREAA